MFSCSVIFPAADPNEKNVIVQKLVFVTEGRPDVELDLKPGKYFGCVFVIIWTFTYVAYHPIH